MQATYWSDVRTSFHQSFPSPSPQPACPLCDGMGMYLPDVPMDHPMHNKLIPCECQREARATRRLTRVERLLGDSTDFARHRHLSFESFAALNRLDGKETALQLARDFARGPLQHDGVTKQGLVLYGRCGTGKTGLAIAALRERALLGEIITAIKFAPFVRQVQRSYGDDSGDADQLIDAAVYADVLFIDDMGDQEATGIASEDKRRIALAILEPRHARNAPTLFAINLDPAAFFAQFGDRLYQRVIELCFWAEVGGEVLRS